MPAAASSPSNFPSVSSGPRLTTYRAERNWNGLWLAVTDFEGKGALLSAVWTARRKGDEPNQGTRLAFRYQGSKPVSDLRGAVQGVGFLARMIEQGRMEPWKRG